MVVGGECARLPLDRRSFTASAGVGGVELFSETAHGRRAPQWKWWHPSIGHNPPATTVRGLGLAPVIECCHPRGKNLAAPSATGPVSAHPAPVSSADASRTLAWSGQGNSSQRVSFWATPQGSRSRNRSPAGSASRAPFGICRWLATGYHFPRSPGESWNRYPPSGVTGTGRPPLEAPMKRRLAAFELDDFPRQTALWGTQWGQLNGRQGPMRTARMVLPVGLTFGWVPPVTNTQAAFRGGASGGGSRDPPPDLG